MRERAKEMPQNRPKRSFQCWSLAGGNCILEAAWQHGANVLCEEQRQAL